MNYGAIGAVIGHEIGHGFDDQGSKYDGRGALHDWWTADDREAFDALTRRLIDQYDGARTRADARPPRQRRADRRREHRRPRRSGASRSRPGGSRWTDGEAEVIDGLTGAQRFFLSWADGLAERRSATRSCCGCCRSTRIRPAEFRCNQVVRNLDEFHEAFGVQAGRRAVARPGRPGADLVAHFTSRETSEPPTPCD